MIRKNFTKKIKSYKSMKIAIYDKRLITTCLICYHTCNDKCILSDDKK